MEADAGLICIECSAPAPSLYTRYGKEAIRLTQCNASAVHPPLNGRWGLSARPRGQPAAHTLLTG